jgi:hypothetical protein
MIVTILLIIYALVFFVSFVAVLLYNNSLHRGTLGVIIAFVIALVWPVLLLFELIKLTLKRK